jgi:ribosome maturation protein Sdo1
MQKEDARKQSREVLHERRKQVIRMHRKCVGVMQIVEQPPERVRKYFGDPKVTYAAS